ncbi:MAG: hypothetical protein ACREV5_08910 [Steroidobacter sp.]
MVLRCGMMTSEAGKCSSYTRLAGLVFGLACCVLAFADEEATVTTQLLAQVRESVRTPEGREILRFAPATLLAQGQVVYYTVRIHNPTPVFIHDISVTQRIPANTTYIPGSAAGPGAEISFSIDGGQSFLPEKHLKVNVADRVQPAQPDRYTHVRWTLRHALAPGAVALARFQAVFR